VILRSFSGVSQEEMISPETPFLCSVWTTHFITLLLIFSVFTSEMVNVPKIH